VGTWEWIAIIAAAAVLVLLVVALVRIRSRRSHLQERFGSEYDRTVADRGRGDAEKRLSEVEHRREELEIRPLTTAARERYLDDWRRAEARFVDDPHDAVESAERLVTRVLEERGYPVADDDDLERRAELIAADHPHLAERYRHGHAMLRSTDEDAQSTEHLRKAMVDFRAVLDELLEERVTA
jgi:hypothetical protein